MLYKLTCSSSDAFSVLLPFERRGFTVVSLIAKDNEAIIELYAGEAAAEQAAAVILASLQRTYAATMTIETTLADAVTIILTTSPAPIHPSTEILDNVLASLAHHSPALKRCRLIVTCDGCNDVQPGQKVKYRSGIVDAASRTNYGEYVEALRASAANGGRGGFAIELLALPQRHGFGGAVRAALPRVTTPLVLVVQHDRTLLRAVDVGELASHLMQSDGAVGYALLPVSKHVEYAHQMRTWLGERKVRGADADITRHARALPTAGRRLLPCLAWHDSTHLASVDYYRQMFASERGVLGFIESALGPRQSADAVELGVEKFLARWRTYVLDDESVHAPMVGHLDGSTVRPNQEELQERGWKDRAWRAE